MKHFLVISDTPQKVRRALVGIGWTCDIRRGWNEDEVYFSCLEKYDDLAHMVLDLLHRADVLRTFCESPNAEQILTDAA